jgi:hypothetical protein
MAKISLSNLAPEDASHFSLGGAEFDVPAGGFYETEDRDLIGNAGVHPWLDVSDDVPVSAVGPAEVAEDDGTPLAVDAGLRQRTVKTVGRGDDKVALTTAADDKLNSEDTN